MRSKSILFAFAMLSAVTSVAQEIMKDGIRFELDSYLGDTTFIVISLEGSQKYEGALTIPSTVTYKGREYSVEGISACAFEDCTNLTSITVSGGVYYINEYAFSGCTNLETVNVTKDMRFVSTHAFDNTKWFDSQPDGLVYIGSAAYKYKGSMPEGTGITIQDGTISISGEAFMNCANLISVSMPSTLTSIDYFAFKNCEKLASVSVPESVVNIGIDAFYGTAWYWAQPDGVLYLGSMLYGCKGFLWTDTLNVREGTKVINRQSVTISYLKCLIIPEGVYDIGVEAFYHCVNLDSVSLPASLQLLSPYAFSECAALKSVIIPQNVAQIGYGAFMDCSALECVRSLAATPAICSDMAFNGVNMDKCVLIVPDGSVDAYRNAEGWNKFKNIRSDVSTNVKAIVNHIPEATYYDLSGHVIPAPQTGINIIRYSNGQTRKVLISE